MLYVHPHCDFSAAPPRPALLWELSVVIYSLDWCFAVRPEEMVDFEEREV